MKVVLLYEFWRYDIPTDVVRYFLKELNIPFDEKVSRRKRNSLYSQSYDEWSKIYVEKKDLVTWLKEEIDRKIRNYGQ
jgi:hypothetical protein